MTTSDSPDVQILKAVQALDAKLTEALNRQTRTLTSSIQALADRHSESVLEQEKRNASFAQRDRVEAVAEHGHNTANTVTALVLRVANSETRITELAGEIQSCRQTIADRTERLLGSTAGYLITFIILLTVALASALVGHALK